MKKIFLSLVMFVSLGTMSAFADSADVSPKVLSAFSNDFNSAKEVNWSAGVNYFRAAFTFNGNHVFAFYNADGDLLGLTRYISSLDLPMNLQISLKKDYSGYWISDLFEVANNNGTNYYITLENADTRIVLKANADTDWKRYNATRKI
ncbi:MAG: hypothetical protein JST17_06770 [Bacteroidetes bacterium]|nr:hypothetical protein [Bacteroidota bacterium]MBS1929739.1 hypothetical protein [Bacteroidota bacterium]